MKPSDETCDVAITGGGLAGLTLALQLKGRFGDALDVRLIERRRHPVPAAAHKVGESSVEIGAHYIDTVLGLQAHLDDRQLRKFGFRFFFSEGRRDIENVTELGASRYLHVPSYQLDRGIFENFLAEEASRRGVRFADDAVVRRITLAEEEAGRATGARADCARHRVEWERRGEANVTSARWIVDASGRAGLLKRQLGLAEANAHEAHAVWFRIADRIVIDEWSDDAAWQARCNPRARWLSTNHLVGAGYWVWLIPLASGSHSVGIVADPRLHPLERMDSFDKAMAWFERYQPRLFDALEGKRDRLQDFAFFRRFSYGCRQLFSGDRRWALVGEAGLFLDPFYSPGSDFIAIGNTYVTDLISRDFAGERIAARAEIYDRLFHSFYESTLALYVDQYPLFGDPEVLPVKVIWDYAYYWGVLSQLFFHDRLTDLSAIGDLRGELQQCQRLNEHVQRLLREWSKSRPVEAVPHPRAMLDQATLPWFAELNRSLNDRLDDAGFRARIRRSTMQLRQLAAEIAEHANAVSRSIDAASLREAIGEGVEAPSEPMLFPVATAATASAPAVACAEAAI